MSEFWKLESALHTLPILEGELVASWLSRMAARSCRHERALRWNCNARVLAYVAKHIPSGQNIGFEQLVREHTLLSLRRPVLSKEAWARLIDQLQQQGRSPACNPRPKDGLKTCPLCRKHEMTLGLQTWRLWHNLPLVRYCIHCGSPLVARIPPGGTGGPSCLDISEGASLAVSEPCGSKHQQFAQDMADLLSTEPLTDISLFREYIRARAARKYGCDSLSEFAGLVIDTYGWSFLESLPMPYPNLKSLLQTVFYEGRLVNPVAIVLSSRATEASPKDIYTSLRTKHNDGA